MKVDLNEDELKVINKYMQDLDLGYYRQHFINRTLSPEETERIFPLIRKLLTYGQELEGSGTKQDGDPNYKELIQSIDNNNEYARNLASQKSSILKRLISNYRRAAMAEAQDQLFRMKIVDMTGYQFQDYLKAIGLI